MENNVPGKPGLIFMFIGLVANAATTITKSEFIAWLTIISTSVAIIYYVIQIIKAVAPTVTKIILYIKSLKK